MNRRNKKYKFSNVFKKTFLFRYIGIIGMLLLGLIMIVLFYFKDIKADHIRENRIRLENENMQEKQYLNALLKTQMEWLEVVAHICEVSMEANLDIGSEFIENYETDVMRLGFMDTNGKICFNINESKDVSNLKFYKKIMSGEKTISCVLKNGWKNKNSVVLAVPIKKDANVVGAVCAEYTVGFFSITEMGEVGQLATSKVHTYILCILSVIAMTIFFLVVYLIYKMEVTAREQRKDPLTGMYMRSDAKLLVEQSLRSLTSTTYGACFFIDIDCFKDINDKYGHDEGDKILAQVSNILKKCTRQKDIVCRFGGDEFLIWLNNVDNVTMVNEIGNRILCMIRENTKVNISIGATMIQQDDNDYDTIVKRADIALYKAKEKGKNQYVLL